MAGMKSLMSLSADASASFLAHSYVRVEFGQGTRAWHDWRKQGIGASDAASILGENPFKTANAVMAEKLSATIETVNTTQVALGVALEPNARQAYCRSSLTAVEPACVQNTEHTWMRASLDGLSADGQRVIEIKCGRAAYWRTATTGRPPAYYVPQLQHILAITGLPRIDFVCHFPPLRAICLTIDRDDAYIARLVETEKEFWRQLVEMRMARSSMAVAA